MEIIERVSQYNSAWTTMELYGIADFGVNLELVDKQKSFEYYETHTLKIRGIQDAAAF